MPNTATSTETLLQERSKSPVSVGTNVFCLLSSVIVLPEKNDTKGLYNWTDV